MSPDDALERILQLAPPLVLIDGPSGSGKSTFADRLVARWPRLQLVRLDWMYPGWSGLEAASRAMVDDLLRPRAGGAPGRWRRWDWSTDAAAEWHELDPDRPLLVEGCGALPRAVAGLARVGVWLAADDEVRRRRALARDEGGFDAHWQMWEDQWRAYVDRERPKEQASVLARVP